MGRWFFATTAVLALLVVQSVAAPTEATTKALFQLVRDCRLSDALRTFSALEKPSADDEYLAGYALMLLNRPDDAAPHLDAAKVRGWSKWPGWTPVETLLDRIAEVRRLAPPVLDQQIDAAIEVHAGPSTAWSAAVQRALPEFAAVGRRIFGADLPRERLYLIANYQQYDGLFRALFGAGSPAAQQNGTGTTNVVLFCEQYADGTRTTLARYQDAIGDVLHEFGHAWCNTYLMDRHSRAWISVSMRHPWLDEGLAEVVASLREPAYLERETAWLKSNAKSLRAPTFAGLTSHNCFYNTDNVYARYCFSAALVAELVGRGDRAPAQIRAILDAIGKTGDVEASVLAVTGKDVQKEFANVVARFW